jgi:hypothetical protein
LEFDHRVQNPNADFGKLLAGFPHGWLFREVE